NGKKVLDRISLQIEAGQTVALVGPTGSGKSTLINLLPRLSNPPRGSVFVDGHDVRDIPLAVLRGAIGVVPQVPVFFSDTLANNVAFGLDAIVDEGADGPGRERPRPVGERAGGAGRPGSAGEDRLPRVLEAAAVARLDKDVVDFPSGYETRVG